MIITIFQELQVRSKMNDSGIQDVSINFELTTFLLHIWTNMYVGTLNWKIISIF